MGLTFINLTEVRPTTAPELAGTLVLALSLAEASAKIRTGPPVDDEADYALPVWAGELPLRVIADAPVADPRSIEGVAVPDYIQGRFWRGALLPESNNGPIGGLSQSDD
jgi:hypothetical protein